MSLDHWKLLRDEILRLRQRIAIDRKLPREPVGKGMRSRACANLRAFGTWPKFRTSISPSCLLALVRCTQVLSCRGGAKRVGLTDALQYCGPPPRAIQLLRQAATVPRSPTHPLLESCLQTQTDAGWPRTQQNFPETLRHGPSARLRVDNVKAKTESILPQNVMVRALLLYSVSDVQIHSV